MGTTIQKRFHSQRSDSEIRLRISVHSGVVIAVHLDSGIDYFGATINKCAKIQSLAGAGEIVMTEESFKLLNLESKDTQCRSEIYGVGSARPLQVKVQSIRSD